MLTHEQLLQLLDYNPETGVFVRRVSSVAPKLKFIGIDGKPGNSPAGEHGRRALFNAATRGLGIFTVPAGVRE